MWKYMYINTLQKLLSKMYRCKELDSETLKSEYT